MVAANVGALLVGAGAIAAPKEELPNFFEGSEVTRDISGAVGSASCESRGSQLDVGGTPASVKNW